MPISENLFNTLSKLILCRGDISNFRLNTEDFQLLFREAFYNPNPTFREVLKKIVCRCGDKLASPLPDEVMKELFEVIEKEVNPKEVQPTANKAFHSGCVVSANGITLSISNYKLFFEHLRNDLATAVQMLKNDNQKITEKDILRFTRGIIIENLAGKSAVGVYCKQSKTTLVADLTGLSWRAINGHLEAGIPLPAIKELRAKTGWGLLEARNFIDGYSQLLFK